MRRRADGWSVRVIMAVGVFAVLAIPGTTAAWTDPVAVSGTTLSTGTADLKVNNGDAPIFTAMNASTMEGGDSTAGVLTVKNNGDVPLSYYATTTATNADGKNLASEFAVKVTADSATSGSSPNSTCSGSALGSSGTSFGGNLLGSSSNMRSLAVGASETICVQAGLADGTAALGGTTDITFTFTAVTGTTAAPGWTDTVQTSGTTLTMITAFYLGNQGVQADTKTTNPLPLKRTSPTFTTLYNYDTDKDGLPGRMLTRAADLNSTDKNKVQSWDMPVGSTDLPISGTATMRIWSAVRNWDTNKTGSMGVGVYDCDGTGANCITLATGILTSSGSWTNGAAAWTLKNLSLSPSGAYTFVAGRTVEVRVFALNGGQGDLMFAYDTTTYKSALIIQ